MSNESQTPPITPRIWLMLIVASGAIVFALLPKKAIPPPPLEVTLNEVERRDNRLWLKASNQLFSGLLVEYYANSNRQSETEFVEGLIHGTSKGWHTNGTLQVLEHFTNGVSHGIRTKWYSNGATQRVATIVAGQLNGPYQAYHDNGQLSQQITLIAGNPEGESLAWHPDGSLKARTFHKEGELKEQSFWEPGEQLVLPAAQPIQ